MTPEGDRIREVLALLPGTQEQADALADLRTLELLHNSAIQACTEWKARADSLEWQNKILVEGIDKAIFKLKEGPR